MPTSVHPFWDLSLVDRYGTVSLTSHSTLTVWKITHLMRIIMNSLIIRTMGSWMSSMITLPIFYIRPQERMGTVKRWWEVDCSAMSLDWWVGFIYLNFVGDNFMCSYVFLQILDVCHMLKYLMMPYCSCVWQVRSPSHPLQHLVILSLLGEDNNSSCTGAANIWNWVNS